MPPFISSDLQMEWKTFEGYITNQPKEDMNEQFEELFTISLLETICPGLSSPSRRNCFGGILILAK